VAVELGHREAEKDRRLAVELGHKCHREAEKDHRLACRGWERSLLHKGFDVNASAPSH
jgi:hypothetical protein